MITASTPGPSSNLVGAFVTPSVLGRTIRSSRALATQDAIDSSPASPGPDPSRSDSPDSPDPIQIESPFISASPDDGPSPKRRRISISPVIEASSPPPPEAVDNALAFPRASGSDYDSDRVPSDLSDDDHDPPSPESSPIAHHNPDPHAHSPLRNRPHLRASPAPAPHHPIFHKAPRFRTADDQASGLEHKQQHYPLPDAFSPQRRGAKYVPGGLAAELRDWLVEVKGVGGDGGDKDATGSVTALPVVEVGEACRGVGMWLVKGRQLVPDDETGSGRFVNRRIILAGEGRLSGLARRNQVVGGCTVQISPPTWDIDLQDGQWSVVCDWHVL